MPRSLKSCVLLALVAALAACGGNSNSSPTAPSPPQPGAPVYYAAVGASDAAGIGSSAPCLPFTDCPNGMGYVPIIARQLKAKGSTVTLTNLGIPAAVIGPDFQSLGTRYGRDIPGNFLDQELPFVPKNSTVVTVFAGGNDTNTIVAAIGGGAAGSDPNGYVDQQIRAFGNDFTNLIKGIRDRAPSARIVVANLPNFAGMPFTAGYAADRRLLVQKISVGLSTQVINPLAGQGIPVVDLLCNPRFADRGVYSSDGFHPNDAGYQLLATEMLAAIESNGYPAPQSSCGNMVIAR